MSLFFPRVAFVLPPTGAYCREDRCQSYFAPDLIPSLRPPLEETQAAAGVRGAGGEAKMIDAPAERIGMAQTLDRLLSWKPSLVVLGVTFGSLSDDLAFAAALSQRTRAPIALRGAPCYVHAETLLAENPQVAFLVRGDYELVFEALVRQGPEQAPGVVRRVAGGITASPSPRAASLDALPHADRSILDPARYRVRFTRRAQATLHVQRGCPFPCTYCLVGTVSGTKARHRSPEGIASEAAELWKQGYRDFYLRAETFTLDKAWAQETARALFRAVPGARWVSATRVDAVDAATLKVMGENGCYGLAFGVETGSARIGEKIRKVPDAARTLRAFRACDRAGIATLMYVMLGFLWETPETVNETARFIHSVRPDLLTLYWAHPYPGTVYGDEVARAGLISAPAFAQARQAFEPPGLPSRQIRRRALALTARHYLRPAVWASLARKLGPVLFPALRRLRHDPEMSRASPPVATDATGPFPHA